MGVFLAWLLYCILKYISVDFCVILGILQFESILDSRISAIFEIQQDIADSDIRFVCMKDTEKKIVTLKRFDDTVSTKKGKKKAPKDKSKSKDQKNVKISKPKKSTKKIVKEPTKKATKKPAKQKEFKLLPGQTILQFKTNILKDETQTLKVLCVDENTMGWPEEIIKRIIPQQCDNDADSTEHIVNYEVKRGVDSLIQEITCRKIMEMQKNNLWGK